MINNVIATPRRLKHLCTHAYNLGNKRVILIITFGPNKSVTLTSVLLPDLQQVGEDLDMFFEVQRLFHCGTANGLRRGTEENWAEANGQVLHRHFIALSSGGYSLQMIQDIAQSLLETEHNDPE